MELDLFPSQEILLMVWFYCLIFTGVCAAASVLFANRLERFRKAVFGVSILPGLLLALAYALRGFGTLERPLAHWIFEKNELFALHIGLLFDPLTFAVALFFGVSAFAVCIRNRPSIRMSSALAFSWFGICLVASSQTIWMAALGIGIQLLSRIFPQTEAEDIKNIVDDGWSATTRRTWAGFIVLLVGAAGLAAAGVQLDFFTETKWAALEELNPKTIAGGLLFLGLLVVATPAISARSLSDDTEGRTEESVSISEASLSWAAIILFYRLFANIQEPTWLLAVGIGAAISTLGTLLVLPFQKRKGNAIYLWLATMPMATLMILPFLPSREAFLYLVGSIISFCGLWISFDHERTKTDLTAVVVFLLAAFGFVGWTTSSGLVVFFSSFEADPFLRAPIFLLLFFFMAFGWRIGIRGGSREGRQTNLPKWIALGLFLILGFGPLISGRFGGGAIPGEPDWIEGAKSWAWIKSGSLNAGDSEWLGFSISQGLILLSGLTGFFAWRTAELFPFAANFPRAAKAAEGLFGLVWLHALFFRTVSIVGKFWVFGISETLWERRVPQLIIGLTSVFKTAGALFERLADPVTSSGYGRFFFPASKLIQWFHGGNVRLYAWFTLVWVLIFSLYLTR
jgi:hypothetical protein